MIRYGVSSMVDRLGHVLVQAPTAAFGDAFADPRHGYLHPVDLDQARKEHDLFCELLSSLGCTVHQLDGSSPSPDLIYTYDASFVTADGAILLRSGKPNRRGEEQVHAAWYEANDIPVLGAISGSGTVDGGDVMWLHRDLVAVGRSLRTNQAGIDQLRQLLGADVAVFDVPYHGGPEACLHLMSSVSFVSDDLAVVESSLLPSGLYRLLRESEVDLLDIDPSESASLAGNVLAVSPGVVVVVDGNPLLRSDLEARGVEVHPFAGEQIAVNGTGGPTCLTRPLLRR